MTRIQRISGQVSHFFGTFNNTMKIISVYEYKFYAHVCKDYFYASSGQFFVA